MKVDLRKRETVDAMVDLMAILFPNAEVRAEWGASRPQGGPTRHHVRLIIEQERF